MSRFFSRKAVMLCVLALTGCDYSAEDDHFVCDYSAEDDHFVEESITSKRLKEMGVGEYKYLKEIYDGQWEKVCVLPPYYGAVIGLSDEKKEAFIDEKIIQSGLVIDEGCWHFVFFKDAPFDEYFDYVSFKRTREPDIKHNNFSEEQMDDFRQFGFSPSNCAAIDQAAIFKTEYQWRDEDAYTQVTLGVINQ